MNPVLAVVAAAVLVVVVVAVAGVVVSRATVRSSAHRAALLLGEPGADDVQESAALLQPADRRGYGMLRLTPDELLFAPGDGSDVIRVARGEIAEATSSQDLTGVARPVKRPALVIRAHDGQMLALAVADTGAWLTRLD